MAPRAALFLCLAGSLSVTGLWGCQEKAGEAQALKAGLAAAQAAGRIPPLTEAPPRDPAALGAALRRPFADLVGRLGPVTITVTGRYTLSRGDQPEVALAESITLRSAGDGDFALSMRNISSDGQDGRRRQGRRCWQIGEAGYVARLQGPATRLDDPEIPLQRCLGGAIEPFTGLIRLMLDQLTVTAAEQDQIAGRPTLTVVLGRAGDGVEIPPPLPIAWPAPDAPTLGRYGLDAAPDGSERPAARPPLVSTHTRAKALKGLLYMDVETGIPLKGSFEGELIAEKFNEGRTLTFEISVSTEAGIEPIEAPEDARDYGPRRRLFADCEALLGEGGCRVLAEEEIALPAPGEAPPLKIERDDEDDDAPAPTRRRRKRRR